MKHSLDLSFTKTLFLSIVLCCTADTVLAEDLRERLKDANGVQSDLWVYNDIPKAMEEAKKWNKPLFVTFRCVPCKDCASFDADVANGNDRVKELAKAKFTSVRQVEMKGVDLSQFQFDHDLNWAAMFINADGTVYARYGTQSAEGADAYNSIDGLINTMNRVLELHTAYPGNKAELKDKVGKPKPQSNALELPGLHNPAKYAKETTRSNCIHCHNIHDAEHDHAFATGKWSVEMMWKYPLPDSIGLKIDRTSGIRIREVVANTPAAISGITQNEDIVRMNGQRIASIADMQWVLHHLPSSPTSVTVETSKTGRHEIQLANEWKKCDFSWRGSMWNAPPRIPVWFPALTLEQKTKLGLPEADSPLEVRWINTEAKGGQQAANDGLKAKDVVIALAGKPLRFTPEQFQMHVKSNYKVGDSVPITVLRDGTKIDLQLKLVE